MLFHLIQFTSGINHSNFQFKFRHFPTLPVLYLRPFLNIISFDFIYFISGINHSNFELKF